MAAILIIDDEEIIRVLLRFDFEAARYEVTEATNDREGLDGSSQTLSCPN
jgi:CheY-like chemotaxis protein